VLKKPIVRLVISASTHPKALLSSTVCRKEGGCSGLVVVEKRKGSLLIGLACRCGFSRKFSLPLAGSGVRTLAGSALSLEKFSHRPSKSRGGEIRGEYHT